MGTLRISLRFLGTLSDSWGLHSTPQESSGFLCTPGTPDDFWQLLGTLGVLLELPNLLDSLEDILGTPLDILVTSGVS